MNSEGQEDGVLNQGDGFVLHVQKEMETVLPGVYVLGAMGNAVAFETEKGFVQVDTGMNRNMALSLLQKLREIRDVPSIVSTNFYLSTADRLEESIQRDPVRK